MTINESIAYQSVGLPEDIRLCQYRGDYEEALRLIDLRLQQTNLPRSLRLCLQVYGEMFRRMDGQFPYSMEEALEIVQKDIPDFTMEELQTLMDNRNIRWIYLNGEKRLFKRFYSSLVKAVKGFADRASKYLNGSESAVMGTRAANLLDISMEKMIENGSRTNRIRIRASLKLKEEHFVPGMFLRAHLPIPAKCQQQSDIRIEKIWPETGKIAPEDAAQRTVCWEETMEENHEFYVEYSYLHTAVYHDAYHGTGAPSDLSCDTDQLEPHIVFSPYIRELCAELTEGLQTPLEKARAFYDFITLNMHYTFVPDYFVMEDIAGTCARNYNGDCGVFALLFITLCRCAGIPAQWQSGLAAEPTFVGCHDWARFYVEPYGWIFADPSYGISARRLEREPRRQFYFGNLDPCRMVANREFQAEFTIPKEHWRCDPYDNQSGELETDSWGFRYDEFIRDMEILSYEEDIAI